MIVSSRWRCAANRCTNRWPGRSSPDRTTRSDHNPTTGGERLPASTPQLAWSPTPQAQPALRQRYNAPEAELSQGGLRKRQAIHSPDPHGDRHRDHPGVRAGSGSGPGDHPRSVGAGSGPGPGCGPGWGCDRTRPWRSASSTTSRARSRKLAVAETRDAHEKGESAFVGELVALHDDADRLSDGLPCPERLAQRLLGMDLSQRQHRVRSEELADDPCTRVEGVDTRRVDVQGHCRRAVCAVEEKRHATADTERQCSLGEVRPAVMVGQVVHRHRGALPQRLDARAFTCLGLCLVDAHGELVAGGQRQQSSAALQAADARQVSPRHRLDNRA